MISPTFLFLMCFFILGVGLLAGAAYNAYETFDTLSRAVQTEAVVIDLHWTGPSDTPGAVPVVRFVDAQGVEHIAEGSVYSNHDLPSIGDEIDILYDPDNPEAAFWTMSDVWFPTHFLLAVGLCFTAVGLFMFRKNSRR